MRQQFQNSNTTIGLTNNSTTEKWIENIFFSNYFYGLCAVVLSIEATLQQRAPLNGFFYFVTVFLVTTLYYTYPYVRKCSFVSPNSRTNWYSKNYVMISRRQAVITIALLLSLVYFGLTHAESIFEISTTNWAVIAVFPAVGMLYYGLNLLPGEYNLRKIGWLKPFVIGFMWAGMVTVYPVLFYNVMHHIKYTPDSVAFLLFLKNLLFVAVLCILFDIKDYAADHASRLKTFVVRIGLRKTILHLVLPASVFGGLSFIYYATRHHFHCTKIALNIVPFVLLILAGISFRKRRSLLYYLIVIDGLMVVKAVCGIVAIVYF